MSIIRAILVYAGSVLVATTVVSQAAALDLRPVVFRRLAGHEGTVFASVFSSDGEHLVTGDYRSRVIVWHCASGLNTLGLQTSRANANVHYVAISSDSTELAAGTQGNWTTWELPSGRRKYSLRIGRKGKRVGSRIEWPVSGIPFHGGEKPVVIKGPSGRILYWDPSTRKSHVVDNQFVRAVISSDQKLIGSVKLRKNQPPEILITLFRTGETIARMQLDDPGVPLLAFSPDASLVFGATSVKDGTGQLVVWDTRTSSRLMTFAHDLRFVNQMAISFDNRYLFMVGGPNGPPKRVGGALVHEGCSAIAYDLQSERPLQWKFRDGNANAFMTSARGITYTVTAHPTEHVFATGGSGSDVLLWRIQ